MSQQIIENANNILKTNDFGTYTVPTTKLYPFQWNWDSCFTALGIAHTNEKRAWQEIETLFTHQWSDGMVPHIIFHKLSNGYFPGPEVWRTHKKVPTSGITQPPIAGFIVHMLYKRTKNKSLAKQKALKLLPLISAWHDWFFKYRDPQGTGLVAIIHPWESGRDNSADWDTALECVPCDETKIYPRRDIKHVDTSHRPTHKEYSKYMALVELFREHNWNKDVLHDISPFQVVDIAFNAILLKSCFELGCLAKELGMDEISNKSFTYEQKGINALETLWDSSTNQYQCFDRKNNKIIQNGTTSGILSIFANIPQHRCDSIVYSIMELEKCSSYLVPSHHPDDSKFDGLRYWRGPVWLMINYMIIVGLKQSGHHNLAQKIIDDSVNLVKNSGFPEYYNPVNGQPCGGNTFSWTAAMAIEFLLGNKEDNI